MVSDKSKILSLRATKSSWNHGDRLHFFSGTSELVDKEISKLIFLDAVKEEINVVMILVKLLMYLYIFITRAVWG